MTFRSEMPDDVAAALAAVQRVDPSAESMGPGAWDCLLVDADRAEDALAVLPPGSYEDPNDPPTAHTRIVAERLFEPAPEPMPGQTALDVPEGWDG